MQQEIEWKDIKNYEGLYQVSNTGLVRSLNRIDCKNKRQKSRYMCCRNDGNGYIHVGLSKNGKVKMFKIHRLVAEAFIDNPNCYPCINHKDGSKSNNCVDNLEWCTYSQNMKHAYKNGLIHIVKRKGVKLNAVITQ